MKALRAHSLLGLLFIVVGCAHVPTEAGFGDVTRLVAERAAYPLRWDRGVPGDEDVAEAIQDLLAEDLSLDGAVQIALINNHSLQATYEELGISQADVVQAGLLENPIFFASARFPDTRPKGTNLHLGIVHNFLNLLMRPARQRIAEAQFEQTKLRVADEVFGLASATEISYFDAVAAAQVSDMRRLIVDAAEASYELAKSLQVAGNISELDLANERSLYEGARTELARSLGAVIVQRETLTRLMGLWGADAEWTVPRRLPDVPEEESPLEHLESLAIAQRFDLAAAKKAVDVLTLALETARNWRWVAAADVGVSQEREPDGQRVTGPELTIELPIFDQHQARIARLESQLRQLEHESAALAVDIRSEVRLFRADLMMTRDLIGHYIDEVLPLRERIVTLTQRHYNFMLVGGFEVLMAKRHEYDAYQSYIETVRDYWLTRAKLKHAVGGRLPDPSESTPTALLTPPAADTPTRATSLAKTAHG